MTPDSSFTTAIPYHSLPVEELKQMQRTATWLLLNERSSEALQKVRVRYHTIKVELERRRKMMDAGRDE